MYRLEPVWSVDTDQDLPFRHVLGHFPRRSRYAYPDISTALAPSSLERVQMILKRFGAGRSLQGSWSWILDQGYLQHAHLKVALPDHLQALREDLPPVIWQDGLYVPLTMLVLEMPVSFHEKMALETHAL